MSGNQENILPLLFLCFVRSFVRCFLLRFTRRDTIRCYFHFMKSERKQPRKHEYRRSGRKSHEEKNERIFAFCSSHQLVFHPLYSHLFRFNSLWCSCCCHCCCVAFFCPILGFSFCFSIKYRYSVRIFKYLRFTNLFSVRSHHR